MQIDFDRRSAEDYARFLAVRKSPIYQFKGSAAIVPDEYASLIGVKSKRKTGKKYTPAVKLFDYRQTSFASPLSVASMRFSQTADSAKL